MHHRTAPSSRTRESHERDECAEWPAREPCEEVATPFWVDKSSSNNARWLLAGVVGLTLGTTAISVGFNFLAWTRPLAPATLYAAAAAVALSSLDDCLKGASRDQCCLTAKSSCYVLLCYTPASSRLTL